MTRLASPELRIIRTMLIKEFGSASPLLDQIAALAFDIRHMTGTGYFVHFTNAEQLPRIDKLNAELSEDLRTSLDEPADLVAFTLFIRDGFLSSFEGYTFGDVGWPTEPMENWLIFNAPEADAADLYGSQSYPEHREIHAPRTEIRLSGSTSFRVASKG